MLFLALTFPVHPPTEVGATLSYTIHINWCVIRIGLDFMDNTGVRVDYEVCRAIQMP